MNKKYLLSLSLLATVFVAVLIVKYDDALTQPSSDESTETSVTMLPPSNSIVIPDIKTYSDQAAAIVVGTVKEVVNDSNQKGLVHSKVVVEEVLKGQNLPTVLGVDLQGGWSEGDLKVIFTDETANLVVGERVLLFLWKDPTGAYRIFAEDAGKCLIDKDGNVTGASVFTMPLALLETKIREALASSVQQ